MVLAKEESSSSFEFAYEDEEEEAATTKTTKTSLFSSKSLPALGNNAPREIVRAPYLGAAPTLPGVDAHIGREELKYNTLSDALRREKWTGVFAAKKALSSSSSSCSSSSLEISREEIELQKSLKRVVQWIDVKFGDGDGAISQHELEHAFRFVHRQRSAAADRQRGRALMRRLVVLMGRRDVDIKGLFELFDDSQGGKGDGKITMVEIRAGLKKLQDSEAQMVERSTLAFADMTEASAIEQHRHDIRKRDSKDIEAMIEYEALHNTGLGSVNNAAAAANSRGELKFTEQDVLDVHRMLDVDVDGLVSLEDFRRGVEPPATAQDEDAADEAALVLTHLEDSMKERGQRVVDVFRSMDADGSGTVSAKELAQMLQFLAGKSSRQRANERREQKKQAKQSRDEKQKQTEQSALRDRQSRAKAAGATRALTRLEALLRKKGNLRVTDLVSKAGFDKSGDDTLDADELRAALKSGGLELPMADIKLLIDFIDNDGDGSLDAAELEAAMRRHRRDQHDEAPTVDNTPEAPPVRVINSKKKNKKKKPKVFSDDPLAREFDTSWLTSLDAFIGRHTGPQHQQHSPNRNNFKSSSSQAPALPS